MSLKHSGLPVNRLQNAQNSPMFAVLAYCASSILMTVTNKYVLSGGQFNLNCVVLAVQGSVSVIVITSLKSAGIVNFRSLNTEDAKKWFPISVALVGMIFTGSKAVQMLSIPVYTIFKNVTIILIAYGEVLWFGGSVTPMMLLSFFLIVFSSIVAGWSDISVAAAQAASSNAGGNTVALINPGYFWMFANCFTNAAYVLYLRKRIKVLNFSDLDTMFYNNLLSIPVLAVASLLFEDWSAVNVAKNFPADTRNVLFLSMIISGLLALGIAYTTGWCLRVTSSTTYSMVGALNKLPIALSGLIFFETAVTFSSVTAIMLGFLAGLVYAAAKVQQQKMKDTQLPVSNKA
jgi:GDP-mannose transporter